MAVFGVLTMHEDDARRAATAALGMLDASTWPHAGGQWFLTIEDCQWASDPLLDIRLAQTSERSATLFMCLARLDLLDRRPGRGQSRPHSMFLQGLSPTESELMAATVMEVDAHLSQGWTRLHPSVVHVFVAVVHPADGAGNDAKATLWQSSTTRGHMDACPARATGVHEPLAPEIACAFSYHGCRRLPTAFRL